MMPFLAEHICTNILFKNLNDPSFKDYYTLEEINEELIELEGAKIEFKFESEEDVKPMRFCMRYSDYLKSFKFCSFIEHEDEIRARTHDFMRLALVN